MQEEIELWQTCVHPESAFLLASPLAEKKNALDDGTNDVDFSLWLVSDDEEGKDDDAKESSDMVQNPLNQVPKPSDTVPDLSMTESSLVVGSSPADEARSANTQSGPALSIAAANVTYQMQINPTQEGQDTHLDVPQNAVGMTEFVGNEEGYAPGGVMFNDQPNPYPINTTNQAHDLYNSWQIPNDFWKHVKDLDMEQFIADHPGSIGLSSQSERKLVRHLLRAESNSSSDTLTIGSNHSSEVVEAGGGDASVNDYLRLYLRKNKSASGERDLTLRETTDIMWVLGDAWTSLFGSQSRVIAQAQSHNEEEHEEDVEAEGMSRKELSAVCTSYVLEHYHPPSLETTVIMPRHNQLTKEVTTWLDQKIAKQKENDATRGFDGPQIRQYDPLGDLTPENEKHEAGRCLSAAGLIFEQDITGKSDWYDHGMAGAYHFIPKSETDKWNDDSNFKVSDEVFEELIDDMYSDKKVCTEQCDGYTSKVVEDVTMKDAVPAPGVNDVSEQLVHDTRKEAMHHQVSLEEPARQFQSLTVKETTHERVSVQPVKRAESSPRKETMLKRIHQLTPTGESKRKIAKLDTTPHHSPIAVQSFDSVSSADSFKTACGSPLVIPSSPPLPIPSFHTDRPSTPERRTLRQSKGSNIRQDTYKKTTKNIFAAVENRDTSTPGSGSSGGSLSRLVQPSPLEGYSAHAHQGHSQNAPRVLGSPIQFVRRKNNSTPASMPPTQYNQNSVPGPVMNQPGPYMGTFYPNVGPHGQQPQQIGGRQFGTSRGNYYFDAQGSRVGNREHMNFSQFERNGGQGHPSYDVPNNHMQHHIAPIMQPRVPAHSHMEPHQTHASNMQHHMASTMQSPAPAHSHMEPHQGYASNMQHHMASTMQHHMASTMQPQALAHSHGGPLQMYASNMHNHMASTMQYQAPAHGHREHPQMYASNMHHDMTPTMQARVPGYSHMEPHQTYTGNMYGQYSHMSPGIGSSDSTISATSQFHGSQGVSRQGYQHATPSKNRTGPSPSPLMATEQSDPRTPDIIDCTPIDFNIPVSNIKSSSREKSVITFQGHKERAEAMAILLTAANASPEMNIMFTESFRNNPTTIILSAPAGKMVRGWIKNLLPDAHVDASMT